METIKEELAKKDRQLKTAEEDIAKANERLEQREASVRETYEIMTKTEKRVFDANAQVRSCEPIILCSHSVRLASSEQGHATY